MELLSGVRMGGVSPDGEDGVKINGRAGMEGRAGGGWKKDWRRESWVGADAQGMVVGGVALWGGRGNPSKRVSFWCPKQVHFGSEKGPFGSERGPFARETGPF